MVNCGAEVIGGGNFSSGNTNIVQRNTVLAAVDVKSKIHPPVGYIVPCSGNCQYQYSNTSSGANSDGANLTARQQYLTDRVCLTNAFYNNLAVSKLHQKKDLRCSSSLSISNSAESRFIGYQRPSLQLCPPPTIAEQIARNAGIPHAPPDPCAYVK